MANRYGGLVKIAYAGTEKRALLQGWENFQNAHPWGSTAAYLLPGVGTAAYGADALRAFSQGRVMAGLGNTLLAGASLIPGVGMLKALGRGAQLANGTRFARAGLAARAASRIPGVSALAPYASTFENWGRAVAPMGGLKPVAAGAGMSVFGSPAVPQYSPSNPYARQLSNYA